MGFCHDQKRINLPIEQFLPIHKDPFDQPVISLAIKRLHVLPPKQDMKPFKRRSRKKTNKSSGMENQCAVLPAMKRYIRTCPISWNWQDVVIL